MSSSSMFMVSGNAVTSNRIIYTPSDFAKTNLNYLQESGTLKALQGHESKRSGLSSYLFFIVLKGSGTLIVEGANYEMHEGDCAFVDCMLNYKHKTSRNLWQLAWVHFSGPNMNGVYDKYLDRGGKYVLTPNQAAYANFCLLLKDIQEIATSSSYIRDMEINEKLTSLLTEIMRNSWNPDQKEKISQKRKDLRRVRDYIDTHFAEDIRLDELARIFYIDKFYLTRIFKKQYGTTINNYLTNVRITNAKKHLRFTDLSIKQIGANCGYNDSNFFIRMFKRSEEMTPVEFRNKWRS